VSGELALRCAACESPLLGSDRFCEECGAPVDTEGGARSADDIGIAAAVTEQGRTHDRNEDAYALQQAPGGAVAALVCDGISTALSGDLAARGAAGAAVAVLAGALRDGAEGRELADATRAAAIAARRAVEQVPWTARSDLALPSCTFVSAACRAGEAVIGWIGDSRAYWLATGDVRRLTVDDSWATEQVADGLLSAEEAAVDRRAHALTRWVGVDAPDDAPHLITLRPATRGRLILCSDGLWNYASEPQQLATIVAALPSVAAPAAVARRLAAVAMERGGRDDITVVVIDLEPARRAAP